MVNEVISTEDPSQEIPKLHRITSLVTNHFRNLIASIPEDLLDRREHEIIKLCYSDEPDLYPPDFDICLRVAFWQEYSRAQENDVRMNMHNVFTGICSERFFYEICSNPRRLAYIITEPMRNKSDRRSILGMGWHKLRSIMLAEPGTNNKTGLTDTKLMDTQLKLFQFLYQYEHGTPLQRIQQENKNTNLNVEVDGNKAMQQSGNEAELRSLLEEVKSRLSGTPMPPEPRIVEPVLVLPPDQARRDAGRKES